MSDRYKQFIQLGDEVIPRRTIQRLRHHVGNAAPPEQMEINFTERVASDILMTDAPFNMINNLCEEENILTNGEENQNPENGNGSESDIRNSLQDVLFNIDECNIQIENKRKPKNLKEFVESEEFSNRISTPVNKTLGELVLMINKFCKTECLTMTGRANLIKLINSIFEEPILPDSRYMIDKILNPQYNAEYHAVCHECTAYIGNFDEVRRSINRCRICNAPVDLSNVSNTNYFVLIDPSAQISDLLHIHENYYDSIVRERISGRYFIRDIYDGKAYRKFISSLLEEDRYSYATSIFNTDGAPKFKSSQYSIWPIYLILNELPPQDRMDNIITCGLWFHKKKPEMTVFLNPFVDLINKLHNEGISCIIKDQERTVKLFVLVCCVDSVARAPIQGIKQFNGNFGCNWCLDPGIWSDGSMKYPLLSYIPETRQSQATIDDMHNATAHNPINGIKYPSPLINLPFFDIIFGFIPDYMHCCLEGVARQFTEYYLESMQLDVREMERFDLIMRDVTLPHQISRLTRCISIRRDWKAREWENFILYISAPLFSTKLSNKLLRHWLLFVESVYILLKEKIHITELDRADQMLHEFVVHAEEYFGTKAMSFNLHQMLHLCESVLNWGPLWAHSTFPFESANYQLLRSIKCARGVTQQIVRFVNMNHSMLILQEYAYRGVCDLVKLYCENVLSLKVQNILKVDDITYFGKGSHYLLDHPLAANLNLSTTNTKSFWKMVKNGCLYSSSSKLNKRSNDSFAQLLGEGFIKIICFIVDTESQQQFTVCQNVLTSNGFSNNFIKLQRIQSIVDDFRIIATTMINNICVYVKVDDIQYICPVPNLLHY